MSFDRDALWLLAWNQLWQVTLAAVVLGSAARILGRKRPHLAYTLWMLVLVKALVPPVVSSRTGVFSWAQTAQTRIASVDLTVAATPLVLTGGSEARAGTAIQSGITGEYSSADQNSLMARDHLLRVLAILWVFGVTASSCFVARKWIVAHHLLRSCETAAADLMERSTALARKLGLTRHVRVVVAEGPFGPAIRGVIRPTVIIPSILVRNLPPDELELILAHELIHVRRSDVLASRMQLAAQLLWWFHPLIWWANREASRVRERCCDQEVVSRLGCTPAAVCAVFLTSSNGKNPLGFNRCPSCPACARRTSRHFDWSTSCDIELIMTDAPRFFAARVPHRCDPHCPRRRAGTSATLGQSCERTTPSSPGKRGADRNHRRCRPGRASSGRRPTEVDGGRRPREMGGEDAREGVRFGWPACRRAVEVRVREDPTSGKEPGPCGGNEPSGKGTEGATGATNVPHFSGSRPPGPSMTYPGTGPRGLGGADVRQGVRLKGAGR